MTVKQKEWAVTAAAAVLVIIIFMTVYFYFLQPKMAERQSAQAKVAQEQEMVQQLEQQLRDEAREKEEGAERTTDLQRQLPVVRLTDQFIMDLNMAEEISGVRIKDMDMTYDHEVYEWETPETSIQPGTDEGYADQDEDERPDEYEEEAARGNIPGQKVRNIAKQTAAIHVMVNTYEHLAAFLDEIDELERKVNIESVFVMGEEEDMIFDGEDSILFEVTVSSFYYPELEHLEDEAPLQSYPPKDERDQPFID